ncbi:MAG: c-type cytochrome [Chloroflexi bacterium]|nr:c-type cytochrome [Chloroflexota bacterium]
MKRPKLLAICAVVLAVIVGVAGGMTYAATVFNKAANAHVRIIAGSNIGLYSNSSATNVVSTIEIGDVARGESEDVTFYVKNNGGVSTIISQGASTMPASVGTITLTFDGNTQKTLAPGEISKVVATFRAASGAAAGDVNFTISINYIDATDSTPGPTPTPIPTSTPTPTPTPAPGTVSYSATIQPILNASCVACHGSGGSAGVNLTSYSATMATAGVVAGDAANSLLYKSLTGNGATKMPIGGSLTSEQITAVQNWINQGARNN